MLSRDDVIYGYQFLLGRDPESDEIIVSQQQNHTSLADFRTSLLRSTEFIGQESHILGATADALSIRFHGRSDSLLLAALLENAFKKALALESRLTPEILSMPGMSGRHYRRLINNLVGSMPDPRYLEIGSWTGSTACAAMYGNQARITCIDNWSQFGGPRETFFHNINTFRNERTQFDFIEADFREIDYGALGKYNIYLFDGPHGYQDQFDGTIAALAALDSEYVFIVDDWNWSEPRDGSLSALRSRGLDPVYSIEIRTTQDGTHPPIQMQNSDWHNGYYMAVIRRNGLL
jgi:hypothetical protein